MNTRKQSLDVLRGIAVLMVIVSHYPYFHWMTAGWFGVDLFFVLSGFLISGLLFGELQQSGNIRIGRFLIRRGFKIYPSFYLFLFVTAGIWPVLRSHLVGYSVFLQNFLPVIHDSRAWGHLWSLAVEEHFYLVLPFVLIGLTSIRKLAAIPAISVALVALCFIFRVAVLHWSHDPTEYGSWMMYLTPSRIDALFIGVAISYCYRFERARFDRISLSRWMLTCPLFMIPALISIDHFSVAWLNSALLANEIGFAMLLMFALSSNITVKPLEYIGQHSYSVYVWHVPVLIYFLAKPMSLWHFLGNIGWALALGILMAKLIEFPALRLRELVYLHDNQPFQNGISPSLSESAQVNLEHV